MNTERKPCIDLTYCQWKKTKGQFTLYATWFRHDKDGSSEPCLVITPSKIPMAPWKPVVILLSDAFKFVNPAEAVSVIRGYLHALAMDGLTNCMAMGDLINDHLSDLISMPPDPRKREVVADGTIIVDGKKRDVEILG